jgi:GWxTD domain-containing protein
MLSKFRLKLLPLILFLILDISSSGASDLYEQGMTQLDSGDWRAALDTWVAATDSSRNIPPDPRIGFSFIKLATERQAAEYYQKANELYFWGLAGDTEKFKDKLRDEINLIKPIASAAEAESWQKAVKDEGPDFARQLRGFWTRKDPIPTTDINERLIEHWERLAHVRKNFKNESTTVYDSDDRGLVFVKFGAPDQTYSGNFGSDQLEIMRWLDDFVLRQEIQRYNNNPDFEIWIYKNLRQSGSTIFMFGRGDGYAKYGLHSGLEELIPERAFRRSSAQTTQGILPGAMLQLMYYSQLVLVDRFYLERYREIEALWANARASGRLGPDYDVIKSLISHYQNVDQATVQFKYLPLDRSDALEGLESLAMKYYAFRYLDNARRSRLCVMAVSTTQTYDDLDFTPFFAEEKSSKFKYRHILISYDDDWMLQQKLVDYPALNNVNTSFYNLDHQSPSLYALVSEKVVLAERKADLQHSDIPDTAKVVGIGSVFLGSIQPLALDSTKFEMSDLMIGVETTESLRKELKYPFPVSPRYNFNRMPTMQVYFEIYFLQKNPVLNMSCEIKRFKVRGGKTEETTERVFNFDTTDHSSKRTLEIDINKLVAGDYELVLIMTNKASKQKITRTAAFRISN